MWQRTNSDNLIFHTPLQSIPSNCYPFFTMPTANMQPVSQEVSQQSTYMTFDIISSSPMHGIHDQNKDVSQLLNHPLVFHYLFSLFCPCFGLVLSLFSSINPINFIQGFCHAMIQWYSIQINDYSYISQFHETFESPNFPSFHPTYFWILCHLQYGHHICKPQQSSSECGARPPRRPRQQMSPHLGHNSFTAWPLFPTGQILFDISRCTDVVLVNIKL